MPSRAATPADEAAEEFATRDLTAEAQRIFAEDLTELETIKASVDLVPAENDPVIREGIAHNPDTGESLGPVSPLNDQAAPPTAYRRRRGSPAPEAAAIEPTPVTPTRSLHYKLADVMFMVERIPKNGVAPAAMGGFAFVQVGDAAKAIRERLALDHVTLMPVEVTLLRAVEHETGRGGVMTTETYHVTWEFVDGESGERHRIQSVGTGADRGDKAAPKAQTNAMKYALLMAFLMPTGDDPEGEDSSERHMNPNPQAQNQQPVIGAPDNTGPVQQGGRQENTSQAQILEIGRFARKLRLGATGLAAIIDQVLPQNKVPDFPPNSDSKTKTDHIATHLRSLKHEQVAEVIQVLMNSTQPEDSDEAAS